MAHSKNSHPKPPPRRFPPTIRKRKKNRPSSSSTASAHRHHNNTSTTTTTTNARAFPAYRTNPPQPHHYTNRPPPPAPHNTPRASPLFHQHHHFPIPPPPPPPLQHRQRHHHAPTNQMRPSSKRPYCPPAKRKRINHQQQHHPHPAPHYHSSLHSSLRRKRARFEGFMEQFQHSMPHNHTPPPPHNHTSLHNTKPSKKRKKPKSKSSHQQQTPRKYTVTEERLNLLKRGHSPSFHSTPTTLLEFSDYQKDIQHLYRAAGVVPYRFNKSRNRIEILLGEECRRKSSVKTWCEFGGKRDKADKTLFDTVCREFSEETCGVLSGNFDAPSSHSLKQSQERMHKKLLECFPQQEAKYRRLQQNLFRSEHSLDKIALQVYAHFGKYVLLIVPFHGQDEMPSSEVFEKCVEINNDPQYCPSRKGTSPINEAQKLTYQWYDLSTIQSHIESKSNFLYPFFGRLCQLFLDDLKDVEALHQDPAEWEKYCNEDNGSTEDK